ncbi:DNA polymerase III subunit gamma/tau [Alphaproteobacteria bacterium]|nr:DNA polymerase III subunit gamma/tau [Alphaproteobacteria bacterium]MDA9591018.1 DNA polymerase III subunit gamma/tau [Alphaproteobacteria bacterium]MDB2431465.1 DNA polymerase III subunit gamma/tau [Alphaproteobacteria bacterium]MDB2477593.1 DNA polymerase III subunit gamma/tau [Alphaproteobacteria bacterium]MDB2488194.1 DNA polymerase III subunit gamma/tau [Alphaproteobacteria bacterium]
MTENNEDNIAPEDALADSEDASLDQVEETAEAPEFSDDAPGFDMLADADADNGTDNKTGNTGASDGSYKVLARKYRPRNFDDLIGQEAMVQTLTNAFDSGRIAHGFMLTGVRGVGKTTTARILARALNYQTETMNTPSMALAEDGAHCAAIMDGTHVDVIEMDAASRTGIGDIREIIDNVRYTPSAARLKVYIIDEVHMLSKAAFNGLLKTLEEPPEHVKFIFATTEIRQVPVTVLSRCQRFDLRRLTLDDTQTLLSRTCASENVSLPEEALKLIARAADGSARDALSLLDRALAHIDPDGSGGVDEATMRGLLGLADRGRIFDLFDLVMAGQVSDALAEFEAQYVMGADPAVILADMAELTHWLTRLKFVPAAQEDIAFSAQLRTRGVAAAEKLSTRILSRVWQVLLAGNDEVARAGNARAAAEMVLIRLAHLADMPSPEELIKQYDAAPKAPAAASTSSNGPVAGAQGSSVQGSGDSSASGPVAGLSSGSASTAPAVMAQTQNAPVLQNFQAVVDMVAQKRDIGLKHALENGVHLVAFEAAAGDRAGRIELRLAEGQDNVAQELTRKLRDWTGQSWVVSLSKEQGAATIGAVKQSAADRREEAALQDPFVKSALAAFPTAEIVSISDFEAGLASDNGEAPLDDGETQDADADA